MKLNPGTEIRIHASDTIITLTPELQDAEVQWARLNQGDRSLVIAFTNRYFLRSGCVDDPAKLKLGQSVRMGMEAGKLPDDVEPPPNEHPSLTAFLVGQKLHSLTMERGGFRVEFDGGSRAVVLSPSGLAMWTAPQEGRAVQ